LAVSAANAAWRKSFAPRGGERPGQQPPEARRDGLRRGEACGRPGADAPAAGDELADRLLQVAGVERLLVARVRMTLDERLADEARHLVAGDRARGLNEAVQRTAKLSAVCSRASRPSIRAIPPARASLPAKVPMIAA
jgi:hypothetical protein